MPVDVECSGMSGAKVAFDQWAEQAINPELLAELTQAAAEAETSLWRYIGEILECHMAQRRLPRMQPATRSPRGQLLIPADHSGNEDNFPNLKRPI